MRRCITFGCLLWALAGLARPALAQPFTLDEKIKPTALTLAPYTAGDGKTDGRIYQSVITQTQPSQYFFAQGLSIFSPDYVGIRATDPAARIHVSLHKETWDQPNVRGQTDNAGRWDARFKTTGDFGIDVTPDHLPATYALLVWVGKEVDAPPPSPFRTSADASARPARHVVLYALGGLLVLAVVIGVFVKFRTASLCLLLAGATLAPPFSRVVRAQDSAYPKAVADMLDQLKSFLEHQESVKDFWESLKALSADEATPDMSDRGPTLPSSCLGAAWTISPEDRGAGSAKYQNCQCMTTAVDKLRANRQMLEKLRILVTNQKVFVDKATALGNSFAQLHTVLGLQWIGIRKHDIDEPYAQFKVISNQKHQALMAAIEKDLKDISECEAKLGEPDWYQKFGFMYYEFLYAAYKPSF